MIKLFNMKLNKHHKLTVILQFTNTPRNQKLKRKCQEAFSYCYIYIRRYVYFSNKVTRLKIRDEEN